MGGLGAGHHLLSPVSAVESVLWLQRRWQQQWELSGGARREETPWLDLCCISGPEGQSEGEASGWSEESPQEEESLCPIASFSPAVSHAGCMHGRYVSIKRDLFSETHNINSAILYV